MDGPEKRTRAAEAQSGRRLPILALLGATAVSETGNVVALLAVPWFVLETTGSAAQTGLTLAATALPTVIAGFFGGALVDRTGYQRMSVLSDLASGVTVALIPLLYQTVGLAFPQLLALVFLGTLLDAPGRTARQSLIPELAALARMPLERANAATQAINRGARLLGAPLAGVLVAGIGASAALWIDALTFAVSAVLVTALVPALAIRATHAEPYLEQLRAGLRFIWADRLVRTLVLSVALTNFLDAPLTVALPVLARDVYGSATALGLLTGALGGGALLGAVVYGAVGSRLPRRATFIGGFLVVAVLLFPLAAFPPLALAVLALAVAGVGAGPINPVLSTVFQERVPVEMRGRVFGALNAIAWLAIPVGLLLSGVLLEAFGLRAVLLGGAGCYLAATLSFFFMPALHGMERQNARTPGPSPVATGERSLH